MAFGVTENGFEIKRLADIKLEVENEVKAQLGAFANTVAPSVLATLIGIFSERESLVWELAEEVYNSEYPDTATGAALDNVVALTGVTRLGATKSVIKDVLLFGTNGTLVPASTIFSVDGNPTARFLSDSPVTLGLGTDEVQTLTFGSVTTSGTYKLQHEDQVTAAIPHNALAAAIQSALQALSTLSTVTVTGVAPVFTVTFAGDDGKQPQPTLVVVDNTVLNGILAVTITPAVITEGVEQGKTDCTAESTGPIQALSRTLTVIETPVAGLSDVLNKVDAVEGRNTETDLELRLRRQTTLQLAGAGTVEAIRSRILNITGVTDVIVFENTAEVEVDGRPAKSYEVVVNGGDSADIAQAMWLTKPAGVRTFGNQYTPVIDSQGFTQDIYWSRPTAVDIWLEVDLTTNAQFPTNGLVLAENALVATGNAFGIGQDVIVFPTLLCALHEIPGIVDVVIRIGTAVSPTLDDNISIDPDEVSVFDTSRTTVIEL